MRKPFPFITLLAILLTVLLPSCATQEERPKKIVENGIEIIMNRPEPYEVAGRSVVLTLKREFAIDTESQDLTDRGISQIDDFDVNSEGHVFILSLRNDRNVISHFDQRGNFVRSFGRKGQGPGEIRGRECFRINAKDEIVVTDRYKILAFDKDGELLREFKIPLKTAVGAVLDNGNFLFKDTPMPADERSGKSSSALALHDQGFRRIQELERIEYPDPGSQEIEAIYYKLLWYANGTMIVTASPKKDYELHVFDLQGRPVRTIRKDYRSVPPSEEYRERWRKDLGLRMFELLKDRITFPASLPPFHIFMGDGSGRLYVMTYETGSKPGEFLYDVFDPDGVLVSRASWPRCLSEDVMSFRSFDHVYGKVKNDRFYGLCENENGFPQIVVSELVWGRLK